MNIDDKNNFLKNIRIVFLIVFIAISVVLLIGNDREIQASHGGPTAPSVTLQENKCFRSINEDDDFYCAVRYTLPVKVTPDPTPITTPEAWCLELHNLTGCTDTPVNPTFPKSLEAQHVFLSYYTDCTPVGDCSSGSLIQTVSIPRVGDSLSGVYVGAGHGVTWEDSTVFGCVHSSVTLFTTPSEDCQQAVWASAANDNDAQLTELGQFFVNQLFSLEIVNNTGLNYFVQNNLITDQGKTIVLEALNIADRLLGDFFRAAATGSQAIVFATATAETVLQQQIDAEAAAAQYDDAFETIGDKIGGGATTGGWVVGIVVSIIVFIGVWKTTKEEIWPSVAMSSVFWFVVSLGGVPFSVIALYALVMSLMAIVFGIRKFGTTG